MMRRFGLALATLVLLAAPAAAQRAWLSSGAGSSGPTGPAGGDLGGTYPNPPVVQINGAPVPANPALNQVLQGTAANTLGYKTIPDCQDSSGSHLNYNGSTQSWTCGNSSSGASSTVVNRQPGYISGTYYNPFGLNLGTTGVVAAGNTLYCAWGTVEKTITITQLGIAIATAGTANLDIEVYNNSASNRPGTVAGYTAAFASSVTSGGTYNPPASTMTLSPGGYWWCVDRGDNTVVPVGIATQASGGATLGSSNSGTVLSSGSPIYGISITKTPGTPSDLTSTTGWADVTTAGRVSLISFKVQ